MSGAKKPKKPKVKAKDRRILDKARNKKVPRQRELTKSEVEEVAESFRVHRSR